MWRQSTYHPLLTLTILTFTFSFISGATLIKNTATVGSSPGCETKHGFLPLQGNKLLKTVKWRCTVITCTESGLTSWDGQCYAPRCLHPVRKDGACCSACPDGENCLLPSGQVLNATDVYNDGHKECRCPDIQEGLGWQEDLTNAVCHVLTTPAPTTTTPVPACRLSLTKTLQPGTEKIVPKGEGCRKYVCNETGQLTKLDGTCPSVTCTTPVRKVGTCCPVCLNDPDSSCEPISYMPSPVRKKTYFRMNISSLLLALFGQFMGAKPWTPHDQHHHRPSHHHHHHHDHHHHHHDHHHHKHHHHHGDVQSSPDEDEWDDFSSNESGNDVTDMHGSGTDDSSANTEEEIEEEEEEENEMEAELEDVPGDEARSNTVQKQKSFFWSVKVPKFKTRNHNHQPGGFNLFGGFPWVKG